eukprot:TRINITY_DN2824_c0_g1_i1.p1 TRINITY_DN2824_c0_g1~~TRINITY_DN2824_c0_g1_i1.p1  ORF type:complete len:333 (+),score=37.54 TRINITY_DN2824_c0_g1_i1:1044-2042(+)
MKITAELLWRKFHHTFFGPLFIALWPSRQCYRTPKLRHILVMITLCSAVYPRIRDLLASTLALVEGTPLHNVVNNFIDVFEFYIPIIRDYAAQLHVCRTWEDISGLQQRILWAISCLEDSPYHYVRALLLHFTQLQFLRDRLPNIFKLIEQTPRSFNEEEGEIALSVLARSVSSDTYKSNVEKLNTNFQLIHVYRQISTESDEDFDNHVSTASFQRVDTSEEVMAKLETHFRGVIFSLNNGSWKSFVPDKTLTASSPLESAVQEHYRAQDLAAFLKTQMKQTKKLLVTDNSTSSSLHRFFGPERVVLEPLDRPREYLVPLDPVRPYVIPMDT